jgi:hypothetical protein
MRTKKYEEKYPDYIPFWHLGGSYITDSKRISASNDSVIETTSRYLHEMNEK